MKKYIKSSTENLFALDNDTLMDIAGDPKTDKATLMQLASSPNPYVRIELARNPALPDELKRILSHDPEEDVRVELTYFIDLPEDVINLLSNDKSKYVRDEMRNNIEGGSIWDADEFIAL